MFKVVMGAVLVVFVCGAGGYVLYQDCMEKKDQEMAATATKQAAEQAAALARAEAKRKSDAKAGFAVQINANLTSCQAAADKAHADYSALIQQAAPSKRGVSVVPLKITDAASAVLAATREECQRTHDTRMQSGL